MVPTLEVQRYAKLWSTDTYQAFKSSACGYFCCYVADNILEGRGPTEGLIPENTAHNEKVLMKYFPLDKKGNYTGDGFLSSIKNRIKHAISTVKSLAVRPAESKRLRDFLNGEGDQKVTKMEIARKPVNSGVAKAMNIISLGQFDKMKKKLGYDELYHNYLLVTLANGKTYKVEKNHQVEAVPASAKDFEGATSRSNVPVSDKTLKDMIEDASANDPKFWRYSGREQNCQLFTQQVLDRNDLKPDTPPELQNAKALIDTLPGGSYVPDRITDLAQTLDNAVYGGSSWYQFKTPIPAY